MMNAPGIDAYAMMLPDTVPVDELLPMSDRNGDYRALLREGGLEAVPVAEPGTWVDIGSAALKALIQADSTLPSRAQLLLAAHSIPTLGPEACDSLGELTRRSGLLGVPALAVTGQPCSVLHMALRLGTNEVNALEGDCAVIVLGADRAQHPAERFFFGSVMGDAAIALAMGRRSSRLRVLNISQHSEILATEGELSDQDAIQRFRERNPLLIRHIILRCIEEVGYTLDDVAAIVPHTPYTMIWDVMASLLDYPREAILTEDIGVTGHMNSNDSMVHLLRAIERGRLLTGDLVVLINPGFGGTRGCTLIRV